MAWSDEERRLGPDKLGSGRAGNESRDPQRSPSHRQIASCLPPMRRKHIRPAPSPGPPSTMLRIDVLGWLEVGPGWPQKANLVEPPDQGQEPRQATRLHGRVLKHTHHRRPGSLGRVDRETMGPWDSSDTSWNSQRGNTERAAAGPTQSSISSRRDSHGRPRRMVSLNCTTVSILDVLKGIMCGPV